MKKIILVTLALAAAGVAQAQQQPQFTHYGFNGLALNPAYAGIKGQTEVNIIARDQYLGINNTSGGSDGSLRTGLVSASVPILPISGGVGVLVYYDKAAETSLVHSALSYSQHVKLGAGRLGIGVQGTLTYLSQGTFNAYNLNDPQVPSSGSDHKFDAGAGLWYESPKFYAGLSVNNLFRSVYTQQSLRYKTDATGKIMTDAGGNPIIDGYMNTSRVLGENHAYFTAGYNIEASSTITVTPTVLAKVVLPGSYDATTKYNNQHNYSYEAGVRASFNDQFWGGINYRYEESVSGLVGYGFGEDNRYRIGAAFDLIAFNQAARALASYEIMLQLRMPKAILHTRPAIRTPRYSN